MAQRRLPRSVFDFFDGGAEDETTLRGNRAAFERVRLLPKVLVNVSQVDTGIEIFGARSNLPMAIAPTGGIGAGRNGADLMLARAARAAGIPYTLATPATASIEEVAEKAGGRLWFQLYVFKNREFRMKLVERAKAAGYEADVRHRGPRGRRQARARPEKRFRRAVQPDLAQLARRAVQASLARGHRAPRRPGDEEPRGHGALVHQDHRHRRLGGARDGRHLRLGAVEGDARRLAGQARAEGRGARGRRRARGGAGLRRRGGVQPRRPAAGRRAGHARRAAGGGARGGLEDHGAARRRRAPRRGHPEGARARRASGAHRARDAVRRDGGRRGGRRRAIEILGGEFERAMQLCGGRWGRARCSPGAPRSLA